jgi:hypothetical protein
LLASNACLTIQQNLLQLASLLIFSLGLSFGSAQPSGCTTKAPRKPSGRRGGSPERQQRPRSNDSSAPIRPEGQPFLDNVVAAFALNGSWDHYGACPFEPQRENVLDVRIPLPPELITFLG